MADQLDTDPITITVDGKTYGGWTDMSVSRSLIKCTSNFSMEVSERWTGQNEPWQIPAFSNCQVRIGKDTFLTGFIGSYEPRFDGGSHTVGIEGRSRTHDLVDCMPEVETGQYSGYTLDAIARAICKPFNIGVVVKAPMGDPFPEAVYEKTETAFSFLDRLCRLRSVLCSDDEAGNLVLTQAATAPASGALLQGEGGNIVAASCRLATDKWFSRYRVMTQVGLNFDGLNTPSNVLGLAVDKSVPRYRPFSEMAEAEMDVNQAMARARWRARYNAARALEITVTVAGYRQPDGSLWRVNQLVPVRAPYLKVNRSLLAIGVQFERRPSSGSRTVLTLSPAEGYAPDPASVKLGLGNASIWQSIKSIK